MKNSVSLILAFLAVGLCCGLHLLVLGGTGIFAGLLTGKTLLVGLSAAVILIGILRYARERKRSNPLNPSIDERIQK